MRELNPRQTQFVLEYLVDTNATQAAIRAGYSVKTAYAQGQALLKLPEVKARVEIGLDKQRRDAERRAAENGLTKEKWLAAVADIAFANMDDFAYVNAWERLHLVPKEDRPRDLGRLIKRISESPKGGVSVELHPKLPALELIAKHFGWVSDKIDQNVNHSGTISAGGMSEETLKRVHSNPKLAALALALAEEMDAEDTEPGGPDVKV